MKWFVTGFSLFVFSLSASANLVLNLQGSIGSPIVTYTASGSVTVSTTYASTNSSFGRAPASGEWSSSYDDNLGDVLTDLTNSANNNLPLSGTGVVYAKNSTSFGTIDAIDIDGSSIAGDDDIELDAPSGFPYPELTAGDVVSWSGTGTFTLSTGTFDTVFIQGTYSNPLDGGSFIVNVVPEPATYAAIFGLSGLAYVFYTRRRKSE